jgi:hypothetical protein
MGLAATPVEFKVDGEQVMLNPRCNRRGNSRSLLVLPVSIALGYSRHQGVIRDISASGMFLYSDFTAPIGAEIELKVSSPTAGARPAIYRAIVVRVMSGVTGAAVGIGLTVMGTRPGAALQSLGAALALRESARCRRERTAAGN